MSTAFKLKESTMSLRGQDVRVRELSHGEVRWFANQPDKGLASDKLISMGTIDPAIAVEDVPSLPSDVSTALLKEIMRLSGWGADEKEPNAG